MLDILLLDCARELKEKLSKLGFNVSEGTIGFVNGVRQLPSQVYEKEVFVYDPTMLGRNTKGYFTEETIKDVTPEYSINHFKEHILNGAVFLVFLNNLTIDADPQKRAYDWIPFMPKLCPTKDQKPIVVKMNKYSDHNFLLPLISGIELDLPVKQKLKSRANEKEETNFEHKTTGAFDTIPLIFNFNEEVLGLSIRIGKGRLIILPKCKSNNDVALTFFNRVIPQLFNFETRVNMIDKFISPDEQKEQKEIEKMNEVLEKATKLLHEAKERLNSAKLKKVNIIKSDESAVLVLNYFEMAEQQEDVSLFYLYKIIEALERKYGSESEAKNVLGLSVEWNLIGKIANASYADVRHAPKPGEKIKEPTNEEIKNCFIGVEKIIISYFNQIFSSTEQDERIK